MTTYYMDREDGDDFGSDFSFYNHPTSPANGAYSTTTAAKYGSNSLAFSGGSTTSSANIHYFYDESFQFRGSQFTVEAWVYFTSHSATANEGIAGFGVLSSSNLSWYLGMNTSGQLTFQYSLTGAALLSITSAFSPTLNTWYHVAVDRDSSGVIRLYLNGAVVASTTDTGSLFASSNSLYIGNDPALTRRFPGYMQDIRITKGIARYAGTFTPPTAALPHTFPEDPYFYLTSLLVHGRMDGTGTSFGQRLRNFLTGLNTSSSASVKRTLVDGDSIRLKASPSPTLVGNATWTKQSRTVTIPNAVTTLINDCDTAWTAVSPATTTTSSSCKTGTLSTRITVTTSSAIGKVAYLNLGSTLDLSTFQQIAFWVQCSSGFQGNIASLYLCTDTTGDVPVHRMDLQPINANSTWQPAVYDFKTNLNSAIKSVALYIHSKYVGSLTFGFDHIIACKSSSNDDSLTLNSMIGKACNLNWQASTAYSLNDIRRPSSPNRFGLIFKVTTAGTTGSTEPTWPKEIGLSVTDGTVVWTATDCEDTWYAIRSISGTTVTLDTGGSSSSTTGTGYPNATETVATYKLEPVITISDTVNGANGIGNAANTVASNPITISGGWDRTNMSTQSSDTWHSGMDCNGQFFDTAFKNNYVISNVNGTRYNIAFISRTLTTLCFTAKNVQFSCMGSSIGPLIGSYTFLYLYNFTAAMSFYGPLQSLSVDSLVGNYIICHSNNQSSSTTAVGGGQSRTRYNYVFARNNSGYGLGGYTTVFLNYLVNNYYSENNSSASIYMSSSTISSELVVTNATISESTVTNSNYDTYQQTLIIQNLNGQGSHVSYSNFGTIRSVTDVRNTASGFAWRFTTNSFTTMGPWINTPMRLKVLQLAVSANVTYNVRIYARRDNTLASGALFMAGGQVAGCPSDVSVVCDPGSINTWAQSSALTITPTQDGVVEFEFLVYYNGTSNSSSVNYWIDDLSVG
jgi:hypothetical protein